MPSAGLTDSKQERLPRIAIPLVILWLTFCATGGVSGQADSFGGFVMETRLSESEQLDAIRYLQARMAQPYEDGRYFARAVRVLLPSTGNVGVFAYLVTFQTNVPENRAYDLADFYSVAGYYLVLLTRDGEEFDLLDEISLTPLELKERLSLVTIPPPPELISDPEEPDFADAVFDATDPTLAEWRRRLVGPTVPRWEWTDVTGDGLVDCILDIEGFEFQPTSYYVVLITARDGFIEGFRSWGYDTDFSEVVENGVTALRADRYSRTASGDYLPSWRDYYIWNGLRFVLANLNFSEGYAELLPALEELAMDALVEETTPGGRWEGTTRFEINATRFSEDSDIPSEYYFNLARIAEYRGDVVEADRWWRILREYLDAEYDSGLLVDPADLDPAVREAIPAYEEWRDELYGAAEAALEDA